MISTITCERFPPPFLADAGKSRRVGRASCFPFDPWEVSALSPLDVEAPPDTEAPDVEGVSDNNSRSYDLKLLNYKSKLR